MTRSEMRREVINLSEMAHSILTEMQQGDAGRTVAVHIEEGLSARGDKRLLRIMLSNLMGNAWKFKSKNAPHLVRIRCLVGIGMNRLPPET